MTAWAVTVALRGPAWGARSRLRHLHHAPFPDAPGLLARRVSGSPRGASVRYLFESAAAADDFARQRCAGPPTRVDDADLGEPVLIVSAPRSGSTALFEGLARHPGLRSLGGESEGVIEGVPVLHPAAGGYRSHRLATADGGRTASATATTSAAQAVRYGFLADLPAAGGRRVVEKTPENALRLPFLLAVFPGAAVVHLRRDARDTVASMVRAWRHPGFVNIPALPGWRRRAWHLLLPDGWRRFDDAELTRVAAFQWASATEAILDARALVPAHRWFDVDYAELLRAGPRTLAGLSAALGLAPLRVPDLPLSATTATPPRPRRRAPAPAGGPVDDLLAPVVRRLSREEPNVHPPTAPARRRVRFACWLDDVPDGTHPAAHLVVDPTTVLQTGVTVPLPMARHTRFRERFLPGHPILWVRDAAVGALCPYWVRPADFWAVRALVPGEPPPAALPPELLRRLVGAGVLADPTVRKRRVEEADRATAAAAAGFAGTDLCPVRGLLSDPHRHALARYYEQLIDGGSWGLGDDQVRGRYGWHNEPLSRFFHHQLTAYVGRLAGEPVRPSYSYVSAYRAGAVLDRHVDREQCEYTVSVLLAESGPGVAGGWPLHFDTPAGTVTLTQRPGEAVLFRGTRLPHHRPPLPDGNTHTSLLLHYVPAGFRRTLY